MALGSNVNPNFPIPGLDQNSKGFRDNFAIIKKELEEIQGTTLQLTGAVSSNLVKIGSSESLVIDTAISSAIISLEPPNYAVQYNENGFLKGSEQLIFDHLNNSLGIGTTSLAGHSLVTANSVHVGNQVSIHDLESANLMLSTSNLTVVVSNLDNKVEFNTNNNVDIAFVQNNNNILFLSQTGNIGIGTDNPSAKLHVVGNNKEIGKIVSTSASSDNILRLTTSNAASTIGVGLEHRAIGWLGGMRIDSTGTLSLHGGESQDAFLSISTARISIINDGSVGIGSSSPNYILDVNGTFASNGITDISDDVVKSVGINNRNPQHALDIIGDMQLNGVSILNSPPLEAFNAVPVIIDAWPTTEFRTARYTLQVVSDLPEIVHVFEFVCFHANGSALIMNIADLSSGAGLGSVSANIVDQFVEVMFTCNVTRTLVKCTKTYTTN